jgi:hypothetical protein
MEDSQLSKTWKEGFIEVRDALNSFLAQSPMEIKASDMHSYTHKEIMDIFIYGHLAHVDIEKQKVYELWQTQPPLFEMLKFHFYNTLATLFICIGRVSCLSEQELKK